MTNVAIPSVTPALAQEQQASSTRKTIWLWCVLLVVVTAIPYLQVIHQSFVNYDDDAFVLNNFYVNRGLTWEGFRWSWGVQPLSQWHPLTWLTHMVDVQIYGMWAGGHKLDNVALHLINAVLLFHLLRLLTRRVGLSGLAALLWSVHPMRVEAVAWVAERKEVLCTFFTLLTYLAYRWYVLRPSIRRYALVFVLTACALMAKPMAVTIPCVMLLLDYWPLGRADLTLSKASLRRWGMLVLEKAPLMPLLLVSIYLTMLCQLVSGTVANAIGWPLVARVVTAIVAYQWYLRSTFAPTDMAVLHLTTFDLGNGLIIASIIVIVVITALVLHYGRRLPYLLVGWLYFVGTLVPAIGLVQVGAQRYAERYSYIPSIGLFIAIVWGAADLAARVPIRHGVQIGASAAAVVVFAFVTWLQVGYWVNSVALWTRDIQLEPENAIAYLNRGNAYLDAGQMDLSLEDTLKARWLTPEMYQPWNNLGLFYLRQGNFVTAAQYLRTALRLKSDSPAVLANLGVALANIGQTKMATNAFLEGARIDPTYYFADHNAAIILDGEGQTEKAIPYYHLTLLLNSKDNDVRTRLASALLRTGKRQEGLAELGIVLQQSPTFEPALKLKQRVDAGLPILPPQGYKEIFQKMTATQPAASGGATPVFRGMERFEPMPAPR